MTQSDTDMKRFSVVPVQWVVSLLLCLTLTACGGGLDADEDDSNNQSPAANVIAASDFSANEETTVALTANGRGQTEALTYGWRVSPALTINHPDTSSPDATFQAPTVTTNTQYRFTVTVTDANGNTASDELVVTIVPVNEPPVAVIVANAYPGFEPNNYPAGAEIRLDASQSYDVDSVQATEIADWSWQQSSGPDVTDGISLNGSELVFDAPIRDPGPTLTFVLTVTDHEGATATTQIVLSVLSAQDTLPTVSAGSDHGVQSGDVILLRGAAASVNPQAYPLSYRWLNDSALQPQIVAANALQTYAIAPLVSDTQMATFSLQVTDAYGNTVEDSVSVVIEKAPLARINDTGVALRTDAQGIASAPISDYPGQDADRGRDSAAQAGQLAKAGKGDKGFDFTRLDYLGDEIGDNDPLWSCVRDNLTGLIWERKIPGDPIHSNDFTYTWYSGSNNGGYEGVRGSTNTSCGISSCDTNSYVIAINTKGLCGYYDWRLPTPEELLSIMHYGQSAPPLIDQNYFPFATVSNATQVWYWSNSSSADGISSTAQNAWAMDVNSGNDNFLNKSTPAYIRLVRGGR